MFFFCPPLYRWKSNRPRYLTMTEPPSRHNVRLHDRVPTLRELYHYVVVRVSYKWEQLGVYLELDRDGSRLAAIKRSYIQLGVETCCMQMFMVWLNEGKRELVNWGTIFSCLENIGSKAVIKEIIRNLAGMSSKRANC